MIILSIYAITVLTLLILFKISDKAHRYVVLLFCDKGIDMLTISFAILHPLLILQLITNSESILRLVSYLSLKIDESSLSFINRMYL